MRMLTYLLINIASVTLPFIYSFHKRLNFYRTWYAFWPAAFATGAVFISWDVYFTRLGVWGFNSDYLIGVTWFGLPVEEWLFFICIPYACLFTYHCLNQLVRKNYLAGKAKQITSILLGVLFVLGFANLEKLYTSVTFLATAVLLLLHLTVFKSDYLGRFYFAYTILIIPFLATNGILTGSFIADEVVWYNNGENLGVRFFTIPVEDFIYGLLLILSNITIYEALISRKRAQIREEQNSKAHRLGIPV